MERWISKQQQFISQYLSTHSFNLLSFIMFFFVFLKVPDAPSTIERTMMVYVHILKMISSITPWSNNIFVDWNFLVHGRPKTHLRFFNKSRRQKKRKLPSRAKESSDFLYSLKISDDKDATWISYRYEITQQQNAIRLIRGWKPFDFTWRWLWWR